MYNKGGKGGKISKGDFNMCCGVVLFTPFVLQVLLSLRASLLIIPCLISPLSREQLSCHLHAPTHYSHSSDPQSSLTLAKGDVVKIHVGAHIDGFASISAETIIVGATSEEPATGRRADVVKAAWHAAELAMRLIKTENKNWAVTEGVNKIVSAWNCKAVEGM